MSIPNSADTLLETWVNEANSRVAESALAHWLLDPRVADAMRSAASWSRVQARRAGYALEVAIAAGLVERSRVAELLRALEIRGEPSAARLVKDAWQPDLPFEISRLRQRYLEALRGEPVLSPGFD